MPSFAQIKRSIEVGARVTMTHYGEHGPGDTIAWGKNVTTLPYAREVAIVKSNAIAFADPQANGGKSWLYWPKAAEVTVHDAQSFTINGAFASHPITYVIEGAP